MRLRNYNNRCMIVLPMQLKDLNKTNLTCQYCFVRDNLCRDTDVDGTFNSIHGNKTVLLAT